MYRLHDEGGGHVQSNTRRNNDVSPPSARHRVHGSKTNGEDLSQRVTSPKLPAQSIDNAIRVVELVFPHTQDRPHAVAKRAIHMAVAISIGE